LNYVQQSNAEEFHLWNFARPLIWTNTSLDMLPTIFGWNHSGGLEGTDDKRNDAAPSTSIVLVNGWDNADKIVNDVFEIVNCLIMCQMNILD